MSKQMLEPCPFCGPGQSQVSLWFDDVSKRWRVGCGRCGCSTGTSPRDKTEAPAIKAWNTRPHCSAASEPVAYLHQCRDSVAEPQLGFEVARNPQWTSEPLYRAVPQTAPAKCGIAHCEYADLLMSIASRLELPRSESGPPDEPLIYEHAIDQLEQLHTDELARRQEAEKKLWAAQAELGRYSQADSSPQAVLTRGPDCACCEQRPRKDCTVPGCTMKDAEWALPASRTLESMIREYARDMRRNSGGGDDYPWEWAKATADYLETLIERSHCQAASAQERSCDSEYYQAKIAERDAELAEVAELLQALLGLERGSSERSMSWLEAYALSRPEREQS